MKKIGIVGGVSWLSTVEYYKTICQLSHQHPLEREPEGPPAVPEMCIESLNINKSFNLRGTAKNEASWRRFDAYFQAALKRLEASGADFAIIASNTPHNRYDAITQGIGIPVLNIFEVVAKECASQGVRSALILGTAPTMASPVFPAVLEKFGILGAVPESDPDKTMVIKLIDQLQAGESRGAAERIHGLVERAFSVISDGRKAVCLACTDYRWRSPGSSTCQRLNSVGFSISTRPSSTPRRPLTTRCRARIPNGPLHRTARVRRSAAEFYLF